MVDVEAGTFTYSSAGHPPPLVCGASGVAFLDGGLGVPLDAAGPAEREEAEVALAPGDLLVLYTDGLIERRGESIADGLDRLAGVAGCAAGRSPAEVADALLRELLDPDGRDDVAVLVHAVRPAAGVLRGASAR